ncbi:VCBS repeat-containing protein [Haloechinothrix sp. LS1_15]|uniref:FG-GAP repeat domain-containing protein n=1 Tax=Haloechinothrix sp. LS1_15 TaxID=2652248 RepID=UPI002945E640|nr:VCBS repeat-containing protein [Haloechinothrix sp. LS1_15]MDV6014724.1 VCBS repeat-containing protein [Haloechinothrix sp. LS1_15]
MSSVLRRAVPITLAIALCVVTGLFTIRPSLGEAESERLAADVDFEVVPVNSAPADARQLREVQPGLERIEAWISAVGAAAALTDLRGLDRAADACLVDPRDDSVRVFPVPGAGGPGYEEFGLVPEGLPYDEAMAPMGCVPADFDEDGSMDFLVYYWGRSPVLFLNEAEPGDTPRAGDFRAHELVEPMEVWNTSALGLADVDGSGHLDIIAGNYFPDGARVLDTEAVSDDRMAMQHSMGKARNAGVNRLLLTSPTGEPGDKPEVRDASTALPDASARSWTLAFGWQDLSGNQLPDLYVANDFGPDNLLVNHSEPGRVRFDEVVAGRDMTTPGSQVLGYGSFKGMGVTFTHNPGMELPMIMVSNITSPFALHESNLVFTGDGDGSRLLDGEVPYTQRAEELGLARSGWAWDVKSGDFDNSGVEEMLQATGFIQGENNRWPELHELAMGNDDLLHHPEAWPNFRPGDDLSGREHNPLWARADDGRYFDIAEHTGIGAPWVSRGFAFGDVDGDGTLDVLVANQWEDSVLLRNRTPNEGKAAFVRLVKPGAAGGQRDAIGATVEHAIGGETKRSQLYPTNGHAGVSASQLQLTLPDGEATEATITWRDGDRVHRDSFEVSPGHHTVVLGTDGTAEMR